MAKEITQLQKTRFTSSIHKMIKTMGPEVNRKWDGNVTWNTHNDRPEIQSEIVSLFTPALKARYVDLLNKLSRGEL